MKKSTGRVPMAQPPGKRHPRLAHAREQRADDPERGPHGGDKLVGRRGVDDRAGGEVHRLPGELILTGALALEGGVDAMIGEDVEQLLHVRQARDVLQRQRLVGQQGGDHQR